MLGFAVNDTSQSLRHRFQLDMPLMIRKCRCLFARSLYLVCWLWNTGPRAALYCPPFVFMFQGTFEQLISQPSCFVKSGDIRLLVILLLFAIKKIVVPFGLSIWNLYFHAVSQFTDLFSSWIVGQILWTSFSLWSDQWAWDAHFF